jgi:sec-independent protein translocase protein TatA
VPDIGPAELIIVVVIALLIFGPGKLGDLGGALGRSMKEFRKGMEDDGSAPTHTDALLSSADDPQANVGAVSAAPTDDRSAADYTVCGNCGARNPGAARFCRECGTAVAA